MKITVSISDEAIFGASSTRKCNMEASRNNYMRDVDAGLQSAFPNADITVMHTEQDYVQIDGRLAHPDSHLVWDILNNAYQGFGWVSTEPDHTCIVVNADYAVYDIPGSAEEEDWLDVQGEAEYTENVDALRGWGKWTAAYDVMVDGEIVTYFVSE